MRSVLEIFFEFLLALTGAVAFASLAVGGAAFGIGCTILGCGYAWRGWRRRSGREDGKRG